jgi:hypothetical protein
MVPWPVSKEALSLGFNFFSSVFIIIVNKLV